MLGEILHQQWRLPCTAVAVVTSAGGEHPRQGSSCSGFELHSCSWWCGAALASIKHRAMCGVLVVSCLVA